MGKDRKAGEDGDDSRCTEERYPLDSTGGILAAVIPRILRGEDAHLSFTLEGSKVCRKLFCG